MDPIDRQALRLRAQADQLRADTRAVLLELEPAVRADLVRTCARGDLTVFDERLQQLVGNLAIVAIFELSEPAGKEG